MTQPPKNPYQSPIMPQGSETEVPQLGHGIVRQIKPISICMIVLGGMEILIGLLYLGMIFFMPQLMTAQQPATPGPGLAPDQAAFMEQVTAWTLGSGGAIAMIAGLLRVVAGFQGMYYRGRKLAIFSHFFGMLNFIVCYCIPTSLCMCIWGCIVHFNASVKKANELSAKGLSTVDVDRELFV